MRWEELFEDLEGQLAAAAAQERESLVQELTRAELTSVRLAARLRSSGGQELTVTLLDGSIVRGSVVAAAETWFELADGVRRHVVTVAGLVSVVGLARGAAVDGRTRRLSLAHALRALARDRVRVVVRTPVAAIAGRLERVLGDHVELWTDGSSAATADLGPANRAPGGSGAVAVPLERILCVSEAG